MWLQISIHSLSKINLLNSFDSQVPVTTGFFFTVQTKMGRKDQYALEHSQELK